MPEYVLTLRITAPGPVEADKIGQGVSGLAREIAARCAAEYGTSDPRLTPADATRWGVRRIDDDHIRLFVNGLLFDFDPSGAADLAQTVRVILGIEAHELAPVDDLCGADPDYLGGQSVDEYIREARRG